MEIGTSLGGSIRSYLRSVNLGVSATVGVCLGRVTGLETVPFRIATGPRLGGAAVTTVRRNRHVTRSPSIGNCHSVSDLVRTLGS